MADTNPLDTRERARKAFNRDHPEVWQAIAGDTEKIQAARAILKRCDEVRDKLYDHYGRHRQARLTRELSGLLAKQAVPNPQLKPKSAGVSFRDLEQQAMRNVADRQRAKLRQVNEIERRLLYREVMEREPGPRRAPKPRSYLFEERNARVLDAVDRAQALRKRVRTHFDKTRDKRMARAVQRGVDNPANEVAMQQVTRLRQIDHAERNVIHEALDRKSFNRAAQKRSGHAIAM